MRICTNNELNVERVYTHIDDIFFVYLMIYGASYEDVLVEITDSIINIRKLIESIVSGHFIPTCAFPL